LSLALRKTKDEKDKTQDCLVKTGPEYHKFQTEISRIGPGKQKFKDLLLKSEFRLGKMKLRLEKMKLRLEKTKLHFGRTKLHLGKSRLELSKTRPGKQDLKDDLLRIKAQSGKFIPEFSQSEIGFAEFKLELSTNVFGIGISRLYISEIKPGKTKLRPESSGFKVQRMGFRDDFDGSNL
jgi:hypothetical protein